MLKPYNTTKISEQSLDPTIQIKSSAKTMQSQNNSYCMISYVQSSKVKPICRVRSQIRGYLGKKEARRDTGKALQNGHVGGHLIS